MSDDARERDGERRRATTARGSRASLTRAKRGGDGRSTV